MSYRALIYHTLHRKPVRPIGPWSELPPGANISTWPPVVNLNRFAIDLPTKRKPGPDDYQAGLGFVDDQVI